MSSVEELKAEGNAYFSAKQFDKAVESFSKAIEVSTVPNHVLYSNRSACFASLKKFDDALKDAEKCVEINPSWAKGYNRIAGAEFGKGHYEDALKSYEKALELEPGNKMAKEGLDTIKNLLEQQKRQPPDLGMGQIFSDPMLIEKLRKNPKTAELMKDPQLVSKVQQLQANPQSMAGEFLKDQRLMTIMASLLGVDLSMNPNAEEKNEHDHDHDHDHDHEHEHEHGHEHEHEHEAKGEEKKDHQQSKAADVEMKDASSSKNQEDDDSVKQANALKQEANALYKKRQFDEAIALYDKAWNLHNDITYLNNRAAAEFEKGDYEQTIKTCEQAVEAGRDMRADYKLVAKSFARIGNTYLKMDDLPKAIHYFEKSLTEHRTPETLNKLRSTEKLLKTRESEAYVDPEKAEEARLSGKEFFSKGDWPNAVKQYTEMIKRAPKDARGYSNRAAALAKLMSFPEAIKDCNEAIKLDPNFIRAYIRKATAQLALKEFSQSMETLSQARAKAIELNDNTSTHEIDQLFHKASSQRFAAVEGESPEQTLERASKDPEVVAILQDPVMNSILQQARDNPAALQEHMKNPEVYKKITTLMAAGIIRTA